MNIQKFRWSDVENLDYSKPDDGFDLAFEGLKVAAQNLADHKTGSVYAAKAEEYLRAALPLIQLIHVDDAARRRLDALAEANKVEVRRQANHREYLLLFKLAQKRVGRATSATERNKWASILARALREKWDADTMIAKVRMMGGINKAAAAYQPKPNPRDRIDAANPDNCEPHQVEVKLRVVGFGDDVEIGGFIPAAIAQALAKKVRSSLIAGGAR
jgi:hypothetical protein